MSEEKMRAACEHYYGISFDECDVFMQKNWEAAWKASREALVVELPPAPVPQKRYKGRYTQVESAYHQGQISVIRAIEAAGVRVKP